MFDKMRELSKWTVAGMCLLMAACQTDNLPVDGIAEAGDGNVNMVLTVPETMAVTKAGANPNSALGGLSNVDFSQYDLRYQLAVYRVEGEGADATYTLAIEPQVVIAADGYKPASYSLRLTPNRTYKVVAWADFVREGQTEDLHYNTADLRNITIPDLPDQYLLNDESKDAYFGNADLTVEATDAPALEMTLKRPFAKLRVVTTDWGMIDEMPDRMEVTYYGCQRFVGLDALTGTATGVELADDDATVYTAPLDKDNKAYTQGYDQTASNRTVVVDYLLATDDQTPIHMKLKAMNGTTEVSSHDLKTDIPLQRNWLTTVLGNTLTVGGSVTVSIDEAFINDWIVGEEWWRSSGFTPQEPEYDAANNTYRIRTKENFMWLVDNERTVEGKTVSIEADIDMSGVDWKPIITATNAEIYYTVEGNGHTLRNFSINGKGDDYKVSILTMKAFVGVWGKFTGVMRNLTFENITINGRANDEVHTDANGDPIDHSKEYAYFAGCIGYAGSNYSSAGQFENVHAKHVYIKAATGSTATQNIGGLAGWLGTGGGSDPNWTVYMKNCSAEDVHIVGYQAGGLVGEVKADRGVGIVDCWTENVVVRERMFWADALRGTNEGISAFIGNIESGNNVTIRDCSPAANFSILKYSNGQPSDYEPASEYYGSCESGTPNIQTTTTTEP